MLLFIFWRLLYFFILGSLLRAQSRRKWLVRWCREHGFGPNPRRPRSGWVTFWVDEIKRKMGRHYDYDAVPVEFHAWILFRGLAEFILINDFVSYALFVISYYEPPADGHHGIMDILRYTGGILLLLFNLWVKVDAHRVVKDFAWYWGDFFLLIDSSCKRDGVFEMAPHPMYSVGYIGFYGAALIAHSYYVLFVSLATHAGQFVFLRLVETPHMNRLYGDDGDRDRETIQKYFRRDLVVVKNFDFFRATDLFTAIIALYSIGSALVLGPIDHQYDWKVQAVGWKVAHTVILGLILHLQSRSKFWSRHYIKFGDTPKEAFNNWKTIYNLTQSMIYLSFSICAFRVYEIPESFSYGYILLKHTIGVVMIVFHIYMTLSSYQAIGDVGWFYGDFFIDELRNRPTKLHYNGIYRFVNNPSSTTWSFWGLSILCSSWALMLVSTIDQICNWVFVEFVEKPHMRRLYGEQPPSRPGAQARSEMEHGHHLLRLGGRWHPRGVANNAVESIVERVEKAVDHAKPRIQALVERTMSVASLTNRKPPSSQELALTHSYLYSLTLEDEDPGEPLVFELGEPIVLQFTAAREYITEHDWIGIYRVTQNPAWDITTSNSSGLEMFVTGLDKDTMEGEGIQMVVDSTGRGRFGNTQVHVSENRDVAGVRTVSGTLTFTGSKIPWHTGVYEARYHHDGKFSVLAISRPFEV
ncbi:phospholipid methyltransferase-domain-containing protein, partial [Polychytrium aggregatum]|uniref:phospholipid methyltransferase-domain-containing protein n=1 Tax=Polychytrium aggregatum TaxID=110093 RepID=UPI0022FEE284